jgi:hypothetical protein
MLQCRHAIPQRSLFDNQNDIAACGEPVEPSAISFQPSVDWNDCATGARASDGAEANLAEGCNLLRKNRGRDFCAVRKRALDSRRGAQGNLSPCVPFPEMR